MKTILILLISISIFVNAEFKRDDNGIVTDTKSALFWQDDFRNENNNTQGELAWRDALIYCEALTLGDYNDWRVPNINELSTLLDRNKELYRSEVFLYPLYWDWTWSSSTSPSNPYNALCVAFSSEVSYFSFDKVKTLSVRCVRGG